MRLWDAIPYAVGVIMLPIAIYSAVCVVRDILRKNRF